MKLDPTLIEPVCEGSILRYTWPDKPGKDRLSRILFANPASKKRERMTLRMSYDEGKTWAVSRLVHAGSAAYSCLTILPDETIGLLYERDNYKKITFSTFTRESLTAK